jgi:hypothetical protein
MVVCTFVTSAFLLPASSQARRLLWFAAEFVARSDGYVSSRARCFGCQVENLPFARPTDLQLRKDYAARGTQQPACLRRQAHHLGHPAILCGAVGSCFVAPVKRSINCQHNLGSGTAQ